ncbi:MAG: hypothetical protein UW30_C0013G0011 [Candidatus Giovannonibacteria bacterium GW2011_GWA2_44_13b]|uniref:Uncharacterized protein n=1 Tax=Candidatus Giovannonibacteria bacterium GW2011_GWA2_44_13b TaxID=1618647 RepID=A0A0G1JAL9_9BACT|nr:MAG: hypothetical protein UW30_C0013G0011 [Candidatus Giovannonibacteria bacterium GW2011_GWA2_44_13b]
MTPSHTWRSFELCAREESDLDIKLRKLAFYPLRRSIAEVGEPTSLFIKYRASALNYNILCPHEESDLDIKLRKLAFYPLNYGDIYTITLIYS